MTMKTYDNFHNFRVPQPTNTTLSWLMRSFEGATNDKIRAWRKCQLISRRTNKRNGHSPDVTECVHIGV